MKKLFKKMKKSLKDASLASLGLVWPSRSDRCLVSFGLHLVFIWFALRPKTPVVLFGLYYDQK